MSKQIHSLQQLIRNHNRPELQALGLGEVLATTHRKNQLVTKC